MTSETPPPLDDEVTVGVATAAAKRFVEPWNSHDPQRLVALCRPDVHGEDPGIPGGQLTGVDALRAWLEENYTALPDLIFEREGPLLLAVDQRSFGQQWRAHGTMRGPFRGMAPTKHPVTFEGVDIHAYRGGALPRVRTVYDQLPIAVQLAAAPQPGSALDHLGKRMQHLVARRMRTHAYACVRLTRPSRPGRCGVQGVAHRSTRTGSSVTRHHRSAARSSA